MPEDVLGMKVRWAMKVNPDLMAIADSIGIDESHGVITLSGTVPTREMANACELIATGVADVSGIRNLLVCADEEPQKPARAPAEVAQGVAAEVLSRVVIPPGTMPMTDDASGSTQGLLSTVASQGEEPDETAPEKPARPPAEPGPEAPSHGMVLGDTSGTFTAPAIPKVGAHLDFDKEVDEARREAADQPKVERPFAPPSAMISEPDYTGGQVPAPIDTPMSEEEVARAEAAQAKPAKPETPPPAMISQSDYSSTDGTAPVEAPRRETERREPRPPAEPGPEAPSHGMVLGDTSGTFTAPAIPKVGAHLQFDKEVEAARAAAAEQVKDADPAIPTTAMITEPDHLEGGMPQPVVGLPGDEDTEDDEAEPKPARPETPPPAMISQSDYSSTDGTAPVEAPRRETERREPRPPAEPGPEAPSHGMVLGDTSGTFTAPAIPKVGAHLQFDKEVEAARAVAAEQVKDADPAIPTTAMITEPDHLEGGMPQPVVGLPGDEDTEDDEAEPKPARPETPPHFDFDINPEAEKPK